VLASHRRADRRLPRARGKTSSVHAAAVMPWIGGAGASIGCSLLEEAGTFTRAHWIRRTSNTCAAGSGGRAEAGVPGATSLLAPGLWLHVTTFRLHLARFLAASRNNQLNANRSQLADLQRKALIFKACSRRESNPDLEFRKPLFYPLNYGSGAAGD
jgi:hypothetical protein